MHRIVESTPRGGDCSGFRAARAGRNDAIAGQMAGTRPSSYADITDGGGTIVLAPGVYELTETLEFKGILHVNLVGSGWNTILLRKGNGDALRLIDCSFAQVRNMKIIAENGTTSGSGVVLSGQGSSSCTIDKLRIRHEGEVMIGSRKACMRGSCLASRAATGLPHCSGLR